MLLLWRSAQAVECETSHIYICHTSRKTSHFYSIALFYKMQNAILVLSQDRPEKGLRNRSCYKLKLHDDSSLVEEVHQAAVMSQVDVAIRNTEETSKIIQTLNKRWQHVCSCNIWLGHKQSFSQDVIEQDRGSYSNYWNWQLWHDTVWTSDFTLFLTKLSVTYLFCTLFYFILFYFISFHFILFYFIYFIFIFYFF